MAGSSLSPRELRSKETSPNPSPLLLTPKRLTPRLPPIVSDRTPSSSAMPCRPPPPTPEPWSYYHRHCNHNTNCQTQPQRRRRNQNKISSLRTRCKYPEDYQVMRAFLGKHRDFFVNYVVEEIPAVELEYWLTMKREMEGATSVPASVAEQESTSSSSEFKLCMGYNQRDLSDSSGSEEKVPTPPNQSVPIKKDSIIRVDGPNTHIIIAGKQLPGSPKAPLQPMIRKAPNVKREKAPESRKTSSSIRDAKAKAPPESPSCSYELPKVRPTVSLLPVAQREQPLVNPLKISSPCERPRTRRLLPGLLHESERRRVCTPSCIKPRQLHLVKPILDEHKKNVTSMVEDLVVKIFPDALIEMYLVDPQQVYVYWMQSLDYASEQHERIIRRVVAEGRLWFLSRRDLRRLSSPPRHMLAYFNKNYNVCFIPLTVNFGSIVVELWIETAISAQVTVLIDRLQQFVNITLPYHRQYQSLLQESQMSAFLLQVAQAVFEEMLSLDQLIKKILEVAQRLVSADRASLFLVDHKNSELVSTVFDLRYEENQDSEFCKKEIRMPINKGIAGHVAMSGETMNIPDAYMDERFNKAVDEATGYHTVSILCMPIKVRGKVLAVVQMVNKRDKKFFGSDDESAFQVFATFFGLALHHAKLYDKIKRKEQKYKVALEVLGYHNKCCEEDVAKILEERTKEGKINYNDFALNPFEVCEVDKCKSILNMFEDLFDMTMFDLTVLTRFVLTVKKNYRKVPYHNFDHGWAVANSMYVMLKNDTDNRFDFSNRLALFVACLCHDLDHRGYTNKFMSEIASPLAAIYTTSTLEHHHFNMTVTILQQVHKHLCIREFPQDGHNIFYQMAGEEYREVLDSIRQCILATDLAAFFPNLKKINELVFETSQFDWDEGNHRELVKSFCMTGADLSASAKPFSTQLRTVDIIVAEFYQQGDLEREAGRAPVTMMDRRCHDQVPTCQVGFLSQICLPCYRVLAELFPSTTPMLEMVTANLETWKARAEEIKRNNEES